MQNELHKSMKNKELIQLLSLEKSLVYFSTSLTSNEMVLDKMMKLGYIKKYQDDVDLLEDVIVENKQAIEMCNIYRDILSGTMDAFASVISNNLNIVMKMLTAITIIISIPTLIASIWGMNVPLPLSGNPIRILDYIRSFGGIERNHSLYNEEEKDALGGIRHACFGFQMAANAAINLTNWLKTLKT